jgi:hypothetical protein
MFFVGLAIGMVIGVFSMLISWLMLPDKKNYCEDCEKKWKEYESREDL